MKNLKKFFENLWYGSELPNGSRIVVFFLKSCSSVYIMMLSLRKKVFDLGIFKSFHPTVPVIVVGNLTIGGTGKTPLVIALAEYLKQGGYRPGIVSRGYGGKSPVYPLLITDQTTVIHAGDEAILLAQRTQCPIVISPKRVDAIRLLLNHADCNIILSDDGLQHLAMKRDIEIMVVDGERRFGNKQCLPLGPLREPVERSKTVDFIIINGNSHEDGYNMTVLPEGFVHVETGQEYPLEHFKDQWVHVVTGIGNPRRFFDTLTHLQVNYNKREFPDHYMFTKKDLIFEQKFPIVMTEKDAVKCKQFVSPDVNDMYYLKVVTKLDPFFKENFMKKLNQVCSDNIMRKNV